MPNTLTFTTPINVVNIRVAKIAIAHVDETNSQMLVDVFLGGAGGLIWPTPGGSDVWSLRIINGICDSLVADASALKINGVVKMSTVTNATAYTQCLAAYRTSRDSLLTTLATLGILPAGTVT